MGATQKPPCFSRLILPEHRSLKSFALDESEPRIEQNIIERENPFLSCHAFETGQQGADLRLGWNINVNADLDLGKISAEQISRCLSARPWASQKPKKLLYAFARWRF